ncbi:MULTISPECIES: type II toxin-antitoxin system TacA family antitoxin [Pseudoalteromonas]|uniref:type II toxin-antitoxin system TacA family antitoxin n=1 Tax=Pseudoalteromonas TaxID=53246 RepID=UPI000301B39B|nr:MULTISPECIES: DUF1778 domain-containing protein [Pseudoalteromonas]MCF6146069.1 hypothetical protein [Pseudoalteromonas mariniglutinosa NCIMB 1770]
MKTQNMATERITARVTIENRELLERAALLSGATSLNSFLTNVAISEAQRVVNYTNVLRLSEANANALFEALDKPANVNDKLLQAAMKYKARKNNENRENYHRT